jgi:hypothetical protein
MHHAAGSITAGIRGKEWNAAPVAQNAIRRNPGPSWH